MIHLDPTDTFDSLSPRSARLVSEPEPWRASWWAYGAESDTLPGFDPDPDRRSGMPRRCRP